MATTRIRQAVLLSAARHKLEHKHGQHVCSLECLPIFCLNHKIESAARCKQAAMKPQISDCAQKENKRRRFLLLLIVDVPHTASAQISARLVIGRFLYLSTYGTQHRPEASLASD